MSKWRVLFLPLILFMLTVSVGAQETLDRQAELVGIDALEGSLDMEARDLMDYDDPTEQRNVISDVVSIFKNAVKNSEGAIKKAVRSMTYILLIVLAVQLAEVIIGEKQIQIAAASGALAIVVFCASDFRTMIGLGKDTLQEINSFSNALLPVMVSAATMTGSVTGAGVVYTLSSVFTNLMIRFSNAVLVPAVYAYLGLALTDSVTQQERLKQLRELLGWLIEKGLKALVYVFTGFLTVSGIISGAADEAAVKAAKMTLSGVVPVVGGIISNAASSVLSSAALLKNAVGTFGMLSILAIFAVPFINLGVSYMMFKIVTAISGIVGSKQAGLLQAIASAMGYILAMTATCALIGLLSCCFLIKAVHI